MNALIALMRAPVAQDLPAGLVDDDVEIFTTGNEVYATIKGSTLDFASWPESLKAALKADLNNHPNAVQALIDLDLETDDEMLWQYARCRFGSFDGRPDIKDGKFLHTEYWDCGIRGKCPFEGKLCCSMKLSGGVVTAREMQVWELVTEGLLDKEIAARLKISDTTVPQYVRNLCKKGKVRHRGELIRLGTQLNIK